ncbi:[FeFe] hydrogenase, group A [Anaerosporobacter sp.]|uniref:[FeFe] hydrogenase, group A n=1 Tax=Anaerosporobacter sp. TaxID=1872529 RepID=UPI00286F1772|nr:[FeFe] hydrogenase, group A [Anaerosporobacter sp.]
MENNKQKLLQSSLGSVFTVFNDDTLDEITQNYTNLLAVSGRVKSPGIIEVFEGATLEDIIALAGGLIGNGTFKAAQLGMPFGCLLTTTNLKEPFDFSLFEPGIRRSIIILSSEDCIIQYAKFYLDYLYGQIRSGAIPRYIPIQNELRSMNKIFDRIAKGRSNMRDIFFLRELSNTVIQVAKKKHNVTEEIIHHFYDEIVDHIEDKCCYTSQCHHLIKLLITEKCIGCNACNSVCPVDCINGDLKEQHDIDYTRCTHCGACVTKCPVNAITYGDNSLLFLRDLATPNKLVITQMAPSVRVTIGEAFGFEPGVNVEKKIAAGLRALGVDYVFDTTWAADLTIMEEAAELADRLRRYLAGDETVKLPILTSCCPAWVKFIEQNYADMLDVPSSTKSPMQMFASVAKDIWCKEHNLARYEVTSVAIMPCIAKKYEASRPEFSRDLNYDVDYVLTTRELIKIFKDTGINLQEIEDEEIDSIMGEYTGAGIIFGRTGGVIEAATRTALEQITDKTYDIEFECLRGWDGFRCSEIKVDDYLTLRIGVAHGLREAKKMLDKIRSGEEFFHAIEIMACAGGCVGGGGQPKTKNRKEILEKRMEGLNAIDRSLPLRRSHENPTIQEIYDKYLDYPLSHKAHELLHTQYFVRPKK